MSYLPRNSIGYNDEEIASSWLWGCRAAFNCAMVNHYADWLARQETLACARELADHLAMTLSARYAALVAGWNGELDDEFRRKARALRFLCQDISELRRGDHYAERLRLDLERFAETNKEEQVRALEVALEETKQWPEVQQAFKDAFALFRQRKTGEVPAPSK